MMEELWNIQVKAWTENPQFSNAPAPSLLLGQGLACHTYGELFQKLFFDAAAPAGIGADFSMPSVE